MRDRIHRLVSWILFPGLIVWAVPFGEQAAESAEQSARRTETELKVRRFPADTSQQVPAEMPDPEARLVHEGFETGTTAIRVGQYHQNTDPAFVAVGRASLRVVCRKGEHNAESKIDFYPLDHAENGLDNAHIRGYLFFPKDFQIAPCNELKLFGCMARRPGPTDSSGGAGVRVDGTDSFTCRVVIGRNDELQFYTYHPLQRGRYGDHISIGVKIERGRWYCIELQVRANTVLKATPELLKEKPEYQKLVRGDYVVLSDGLARCWVDGILRAELTDVRYRDIPELQIRRCGAFPYFGGAGAQNTSPKDQVFYLDDYVVSRSYIGPEPAFEKKQ